MPQTASASNANMIQAFFENAQKWKDTPLLWEKKRNIYQSLSWKETASRINALARALSAFGIKKYDRIINLLPNECNCMILDFAAITLGAVSTSMPHDWSDDELVSTLNECQSRILFTFDPLLAPRLLTLESKLPLLECIVVHDSFTTKHQGRVKCVTWSSFVESGKNTPDKTLQFIRAVSARDAATLNYYKDEEGNIEAIKRNHQEIIELCHAVNTLSQTVKLKTQERFLVTVPHHHPIGVYAGHFLPILLQSQLYYANTGKTEDLDIRNAKPHYLVGTSDYFTPLIEFSLNRARQAGSVDSKAIDKALELGKIKYENPKGLSLIQKGIEATLKTIVINRIRNELGGEMHAIISVDDKLAYNVQLFFFSFGIDLLELQSES